MARESGLSHTTSRRIWAAFSVQPHRSETFKLSGDPLFVDKVRDIIGLYLSPPDRALVLCVDEKSQIQALDRSQPVLPMLPGMPERCTHDLARNTRASYRDTFSLLLPFVSRKLRKPVDRLAVRDLTSKLVLQLLVHLEEDRGCSVRTRNQRLAAIRAFARFVGSRDPAHVEWCGHIRAIASKKSLSPPVGWLTRADMEAMLAVPDRKTKRGRSEYALLLFLYNTGARVSEVTQLKVRDLQIGRGNGGHDLATLHGKGGKTRQCPLWPETERVLADEIMGRAAEDAVFVSRLGTPFTRFGVYRLVERCAVRVPALAGRTITPHVTRHTTACHLVLAGVDINTIRA